MISDAELCNSETRTIMFLCNANLWSQEFFFDYLQVSVNPLYVLKHNSFPLF